MELFVSCCGWGTRKAWDGTAGIYRIDFDHGRIVQQVEFPIEAGTTRGFGGLTYDDRFVYAARQVNRTQDEIIQFGRDSLRQRDRLVIDQCYDVHQIDLYAGFLWICNTNHHELLIADPARKEVCHRLKLFPEVAGERQLESSARRPHGDHRHRPHMNSILVGAGKVQVGLFGLDGGDFMSPQLLRIPWGLAGGKVETGEVEPVFVTGLRYPHNVHLRPGGALLGCASADGDLVVGNRKVALGGSPRGIALDADNLYVGLSSYSHTVCTIDGQPAAEDAAGIVRLNRYTLAVTGKFSFDKPGQVYDVRLAEGTDYGISAHAEQDPFVAPRRLAI